MKLLNTEIRAFVDEKQRYEVFGRNTAYVDKSKVGYYEHNKKIYKYEITDIFVDYFSEYDEPIKTGVLL